MAAASLRALSWTKGDYHISTDSPAAVLRLPGFYWAEPLPDDVLRETFDNSLSFGLFHKPSGECAGIARCVTDFTTFLYVTDVWVEPELQGKGSAAGSSTACKRSMLFTGNWEKSVPFYKRRMGMDVMESQEGKGLAIMVRNGRGHPSNLAKSKETNGTH
ncbi:hypothetical protein ACCO45_006431 [Purpureocillium lilacinum]|uniref:Uncharacterized protein n=1 Tax=Purpureocillium lilacinum TaxID=33203 RepID=A0ACC4DQX0_PURLI